MIFLHPNFKPNYFMRKRNKINQEDVQFSNVSLVGADYEGDLRIKLSYDNGVSGIVDFKPIFEKTIIALNCPDCEKEFRKYLEPRLFKKFKFDTKFLHWDYKIGYNTQMLYDMCL